MQALLMFGVCRYHLIEPALLVDLVEAGAFQEMSKLMKGSSSNNWEDMIPYYAEVKDGKQLSMLYLRTNQANSVKCICGTCIPPNMIHQGSHESCNFHACLVSDHQQNALK